MLSPDFFRYSKVAGRNLLLLALISGCQDNKAITPVALMPSAPAPTATVQADHECVLPNPPAETLSFDWQPWEKEAEHLTFTLPDGWDIILTKKTVQARNRDGVLKPGIWMTFEEIGPPDWQKKIRQQGYFYPFRTGFFTIRGKLFALYACDEKGENVFWADKIN